MARDLLPELPRSHLLVFPPQRASPTGTSFPGLSLWGTLEIQTVTWKEAVLFFSP